MFRFEDPQYLYLLVVIPIMALIRFVLQRNQRKRLRKFGDPKLLSQLMPDVSKWRPEAKFWILSAALALLIVMLARPQMGTKISHEKRSGIETIIAMDISNSMMAEDVAPSRLRRCKMMVENLVEHFTDDKIGLIVFAGDAFVQLPITSDYVSAKMFLSSIDPSMMAAQGTDIAQAIDMAVHSFTQETEIGRAIIIITDGEDHEGGAIEAAREAKKMGMRVFVLGVGSPNGAPIPMVGRQGNYMTDRMGNTVMTRLNEDMCKQIAKAGGGAYIHVDNNSNAQQQLDNELDKLSKKEIDSVVYSEYDEQFQAFGVIALLLLIIEALLLERKNRLLGKFHLFGAKKKVATTLLLLLISMVAAAQTNDRQYIRDGNREYRGGKYEDAEVTYRKAVEKNPRNPQAAYNLANALMAQNKDSAAVDAFEKAAKLEPNKFRRAMSYHNIGVICQKHQMFKEAIEAYKEALRNNPKDDMTRYNLQLCKKQLKDQDQDQQGDGGGGGNDKQEDQQQQEEQQQQQQQQQQEQQQQDNQMSQENAEQLLNAAIQQEKNTQEKMQKAMQQNSKRQREKNW